MKFYCDNARHLVCVPYSVEGLHQMAEALGIKRGWYHAGRWPHYDIPKRRIREVQTDPRVKVVSSKELLLLLKKAPSEADLE